MAITVKVTEQNGKSWVDDQWVEMPDQEDCDREYNPGALIEITDDKTGEEAVYEVTENV